MRFGDSMLIDVSSNETGEFLQNYIIRISNFENAMTCTFFAFVPRNQDECTRVRVKVGGIDTPM